MLFSTIDANNSSYICSADGYAMPAYFLQTPSQAILFCLYYSLYFLGLALSLMNTMYTFVNRKQLGLSFIHSSLLLFGSFCMFINWAGYLPAQAAYLLQTCDSWIHTSDSALVLQETANLIADECFYFSIGIYSFAIIYR